MRWCLGCVDDDITDVGQGERLLGGGVRTEDVAELGSLVVSRRSVPTLPGAMASVPLDAPVMRAVSPAWSVMTGLPFVEGGGVRGM